MRLDKVNVDQGIAETVAPMTWANGRPTILAAGDVVADAGDDLMSRCAEASVLAYPVTVAAPARSGAAATR